MKRSVSLSLLLCMFFLTQAIPGLRSAAQGSVPDDSASVPVYRLYNGPSGDHLYTLSSGERDQAMANGYVYEGIGFDAPVDGLPVYRLYRGSTGEHFYTSNASERDRVLADSSFVSEGIGFYALPLPCVAPMVPVYRLYRTDLGGHHFYTISSAERDQAVANGSIDEGPRFCVFSSLYPPSWPVVVSAWASPTTVSAGETVTFSIDWADPNSSVQVRAVICKTAWIAAGVCQEGTWATGGFSTQSPATATYTTTSSDVGTQKYYAFACDQWNGCSRTSENAPCDDMPTCDETIVGSVVSSAGNFYVNSDPPYPAPVGGGPDCSIHSNVNTAQADSYHRGVGVWGPGEWVADSDVRCIRISDLDIYQNPGNQLEVGWMETIGRELTGDGCQYTHPNPNPPPHLAIISHYKGVQSCVDAHLTVDSGRFYAWRLQNTDGNYSWKVYVEDNLLATFTENFSSAWALTNGERYGLVDSSWSEWNGLQYQDAAGWHPWNNMQLFCDTDQAYDTDIQPQAHVYSRKTNSNYEYCP